MKEYMPDRAARRLHGYASGGRVSGAPMRADGGRVYDGGAMPHSVTGIAGEQSAPRRDRRPRGGPSKVNIVIATGGGEDKQAALQQGMALGAQMAMARAAQAPPPPPPPMPPGIGGPGMPAGGLAGAAGGPPGLPMMARGGAVDMVEVRGYKRRRSGGRG